MGTIKFVKNEVRYEIHYSYCKSGEGSDPNFEIDMAYINDKDFTEEFEQIANKTEIMNFIKANL
jgi:hypothetical protein